METFSIRQERDEYIRTQVNRSQAKFGYCKVSILDALRVNSILGTTPSEPFLCLGTRNGREIDLFRFASRHPLAATTFSKFEKRKAKGFSGLLDRLIAQGRSNVTQIDNESFVGVEINPAAKRQDVWIGSFDEMPTEWENKFGYIFSNSFDQSMDPEKTAKEWMRVAKNGTILIFHFSQGAKPTQADPVGNITWKDVVSLFSGDLLYYSHRGSENKYNEIVLRIKK